jgi:hypothetical protein
MPTILQELKDYFKTRLNLLKYQTIDNATTIIAELIVDLAIVLILALSFLFFSIALAFFLGQTLKSYWAGFGIVTLFCLVIVCFGYLLKSPLQNSLIRIFIGKTFKKRGH